MTSRFLVTRLRQKLADLEIAVKFPKKPEVRPFALYIEDVLNPENLPSPNEERKREFYMKEISKRVQRAWPNMDPIIKSVTDNQYF